MGRCLSNLLGDAASGRCGHTVRYGACTLIGAVTQAEQATSGLLIRREMRSRMCEQNIVTLCR
jgi:hypothetical protein